MNLQDNRKLQTQKDYSAISQIYNADFGNDHQHFDLIDNALNLLTQQNIIDLPIIDLGSGSGVVSDYLVQKQVKNIRAIDFTSEFCDMIRSKHPGQIEVICEDMVQYLEQSANSSVAAYIANYSIIHIPDDEIDQFFNDISRTLVPGGVFLMSCHKGTFKGMEQEPYQVQRDSRLKVDQPLETYMNYFLEDELKKRIEKIGLSILSLETFQTKPTAGEIPVPKIWALAQKPLASSQNH